MMKRRIPLTLLAIASPALLLASVLGGPAAAVIFAAAAGAFPLLLVALGAGRGRTLAVGLLALLAVYEACLLGMVALHGRDAPWLLGLPLATALEIYGVLLAPLPFVGLLYAWTFERHGVRRRDLEELRARFGGGEEEG